MAEVEVVVVVVVVVVVEEEEEEPVLALLEGRSVDTATTAAGRGAALLSVTLGPAASI